MSDAIRCGQCRWWLREMPSDNCGWCELNPPIYVDVHGESANLTSWSQPRTLPDEGCSRGSPKSGSTITVTLTEEKLLPRRFEEET